MDDISKGRIEKRSVAPDQMNAARPLVFAFAVLAVLLLVAVVGLLYFSPNAPLGAITLATTTSTRDSGLLDYLLPKFREAHGVSVEVIAVGTGAALDYGKRCDADVLMVHSPATEIAWMAQGYGGVRKPVFSNEFIIVGPPGDTAALKGTHNATAAFRALHDTASKFTSRGDSSGTHLAEQKFWKLAGFDYHRAIDIQANSWYINVSGSMGATLLRASELGAYTLSDTGTWYGYKSPLALELEVDGDPALNNQYSIITLNSTRCPQVNHAAADAFQLWVASPEGQAAVGGYVVNGHQLFHPDANP